jgi:hypothetical protein
LRGAAIGGTTNVVLISVVQGVQKANSPLRKFKTCYLERYFPATTGHHRYNEGLPYGNKEKNKSALWKLNRTFPESNRLLFIADFKWRHFFLNFLKICLDKHPYFLLLLPLKSS